MCLGRMSHNSKLAFTFFPLGFSCLRELGTWILHTLVTLFSFAYLNGLFSPSLSQLALYDDRNLTTQAPCRRNTLLVAEIAVSDAEAHGRRRAKSLYRSAPLWVTFTDRPLQSCRNEYVIADADILSVCSAALWELGLGTGHLDDIRIIHQNQKVVYFFVA